MVMGGGSRHGYWEARSLDLSRLGLVEGRVKSRGTPERDILGYLENGKGNTRDS